MSIEKVIEQLAYYVISLNDPAAGGKFIYECMQTPPQTPTEVASAQSLFMEVTRLMSQIDAKYSLKCSKEYLKLVKDDFGTSDELEKLLKQGEEYE